METRARSHPLPRAAPPKSLVRIDRLRGRRADAGARARAPGRERARPQASRRSSAPTARRRSGRSRRRASPTASPRRPPSSTRRSRSSRRSPSRGRSCPRCRCPWTCRRSPSSASSRASPSRARRVYIEAYYDARVSAFRGRAAADIAATAFVVAFAASRRCLRDWGLKRRACIDCGRRRIRRSIEGLSNGLSTPATAASAILGERSRKLSENARATRELKKQSSASNLRHR